MPELFVEKSTEMNAPAQKVWKVLTDPKLTREWIRTWWPDLSVLESGWKRGSPMPGAMETCNRYLPKINEIAEKEQV